MATILEHVRPHRARMQKRVFILNDEPTSYAWDL